MTEHLISGLVIVTGLTAAGTGLALAGSRLRAAGRAYRKTKTLYAAMPDGWSSWFLEGFSGVALGTHWVWAVLTLLGWTLAGVCLIGLGLQLFHRV